MTRPALSRLLATAALLLLPAQAVTFGGLNITPRGAQNLNLETGATELPGGGSATDSRSGLTLSAARMSIVPGQSLTAQGATISTKQGGKLTADTVRYDLAAGTVTATGGVSYTDGRLKALQAGRVTLHVKTGFVVASGSVRASDPAMTGTTFVFDAATQQAVLAGPYSARQGTLNARGDAGDRLLLVFSNRRVVRATAAPDADSLARFLPYLK